MWISYCCRQDPRVGSLKKNKKRRRRFEVGLNEGGKETSLWKQTEIRPQNFFRARTKRNLTTLWIWFCRSFLWCEVLARGTLQEYCCVFSLRVLESIATWMQISLLHDPSCSWQCASSSYLHHASASVFVRVSPGLNLFYTSTAPCKFLLLSSFVPWPSGL